MNILGLTITRTSKAYDEKKAKDMLFEAYTKSQDELWDKLTENNRMESDLKELNRLYGESITALKELARDNIKKSEIIKEHLKAVKELMF